MKKSTKKEILSDFVGLLKEIESKPAEDIENKMRKIISKIRPLIHHI
ncbi:hypothetical protein [Nitrosopumilus sp.]